MTTRRQRTAIRISKLRCWQIIEHQFGSIRARIWSREVVVTMERSV